MENAQPEVRKAFGYLRVSSESQVDGDGFPRQKAAIKKWADANGVKTCVGSRSAVSVAHSNIVPRWMTC